MLLNIALLLAVFGAEKKKFGPYIAALLLGIIKAATYLAFGRGILTAVIVGSLYGGFAAAFVYFLKRLDAREDRDRPAMPNYGSAHSSRVTFRWEYIPVVVLLLLIIGGEFILA